MPDGRARLAELVATLGRGPGRGRALTRAEAGEAMTLVLAGEADPHQVGALLMLLRLRGESIDETAGMVEAARATLPPWRGPVPSLDWPSYGAGRTRAAPWFLLAALALADAGERVLMHGAHDFAAGMHVDTALAALGRAPARNMAEAEDRMHASGFAFLPLPVLSARLQALLDLRTVLGLRSPVNTIARLLDPAGAAAAIDGVFHPPYVTLHLGVAEALGRPRLTVVKGAGGEAERNPAKPCRASVWDSASGRFETSFPAIAPAFRGEAADLVPLWRDEANSPAEAVVCGTIALALLALGRVADPAAAEAEAGHVWRQRRAVSSRRIAAGAAP
ncbi:MAG TPA: glycosyl transferase family protein [Acetobacteraceae bacterium]|nr:glycosyl transferase family protein [Acetobacteraceae bacterium]